MKRFTILMSLVLFIPVVFAKERIVKYKYYKINKIYGPYSQNVTEEYPYLDKEDYIYSEYTETKDIPEDRDGREILEKDVWEYERLKDVNYISIINYTDDVSLTEVTVKYKGEKIDFDTNDDLNSFKNSSEVHLYLKEKLDPTLLEVYIKTNFTFSNFKFTIGCDNLMYAYQSAYLGDEYLFKGIEASYNGGIGDIWTSSYYDEEKPLSRIMRLNGKVKIYQYRDKLYHTYKEEKEYYSEYLFEPINDYLYKDESDYIILDDEDNKTNIKDNTYEYSDLEIEDNIEVVDVPNTGISYTNFSKGIAVKFN